MTPDACYVAGAKRLICICGSIIRAQRVRRANTIPHRVTWYRYEEDKLKAGCCRAPLPEARRPSTRTTGCCCFSCQYGRLCALVPHSGQRASVSHHRSPQHHTKRRQTDLGGLTQIGAVTPKLYRGENCTAYVIRVRNITLIVQRDCLLSGRFQKTFALTLPKTK